jgi:hypothetical protein
MVAIEDHVTAPGLLTGDMEGAAVDGGVERLLRYLRLKHLPALGLARLQEGAGVDGRGCWARLASGRCGEWVGVKGEVVAALEAVALCQEGMQRVGPQLGRAHETGAAVAAAEGEGGDGVRYRHRLGLVRTLLHGEVLALRAVAEFAMAAVEAAERGVAG